MVPFWWLWRWPALDGQEWVGIKREDHLKNLLRSNRLSIHAFTTSTTVSSPFSWAMWRVTATYRCPGGCGACSNMADERLSRQYCLLAAHRHWRFLSMILAASLEYQLSSWYWIPKIGWRMVLRCSLACTRAQCWAKSSNNKLYKTYPKSLRVNSREQTRVLLSQRYYVKVRSNWGISCQWGASYIPKSCI